MKHVWYFTSATANWRKWDCISQQPDEASLQVCIQGNRMACYFVEQQIEFEQQIEVAMVATNFRNLVTI